MRLLVLQLLTVTMLLQFACGALQAGRDGVCSGDSSDFNVFTRQEIESFPARTVSDLLGFFNGTAVVPSRPGSGFGLTTPYLSVRGGPLDGMRTYLNGIDITDPFTGYSTFHVSTRALERLEFDALDVSGRHAAGGFGVAELTTGSGNDRLGGMAEGTSDNTIGTDFDQNWYTASFGGPVDRGGRLRVFGLVERRYFGDRNPSIRTNDFLPGDTKRLPSNSLDSWSYNGRVDYWVGKDVTITATADGSYDEWREYSQPWYFDYEHAPYYKDENSLYTLSGRYQFNDRLAAQTRVSYFKVTSFRGDGAVKEDLDAYRRSFANPGADLYSLFWWGGV